MPRARGSEQVADVRGTAPSAPTMPPARRRPTASAMVGLAGALLLVAAVAAACQSRQGVAPSPAAGTSGAPSPGLASPTPSSVAASPSPAALVAGTVAEAVETFGFPGLPVQQGQRVLVVAGPVDVFGASSFLLQHWGDLEHGLHADSDFGWLAADLAAELLRPVAVTCPDDPPSLREVAALQVFERPLCFGDRSLTFGPVALADLHVGLRTSSRWITERGSPDFFTALPAYPEEAAREVPDGSWVTVTGHFDDASSATCGGITEVARCRQRFMITSIVPAEAPDFVLLGTWRGMRSPPIGGRAGHSVTWTGTEMIAWGGVESARDVRPFVPANGAAYDPAANRWRKIPAAPIKGREFPIAAWTGDELLVWGGRQGSRSLGDGAAYDPAANRWRTLPPAPLDPVPATGEDAGTLAVGGLVGDRLVVVTTTGAAAYDPTTDRWTSLAPAPLRSGWRTAAVAGGRVVVTAFGDGATGDVEGAILDPVTGAWTAITVPLTILESGVAIVAAGDIVVVPAVGKALDPVAGSWSDVPKCEGAGYDAVWTGRYLLGIRAAYDVETGTCLDLPPAPRRAAPFDDSAGREYSAAAWTGDAYLTWSGGTGGDIVWVPNDGAVFRPARDLDPRD